MATSVDELDHHNSQRFNNMRWEWLVDSMDNLEAWAGLVLGGAVLRSVTYGTTPVELGAAILILFTNYKLRDWELPYLAYSPIISSKWWIQCDCDFRFNC